MRNLKKVLSLTLALVMLAGMMVVGAGATSFPDDASIVNQEAVAVMSGLGVMKGKGDGNFDPKGDMTRAEAAKLLATLELGVTASDALAPSGVNNFTDVPASHWAAGAIDYCATQGYVVGDGNGNFNPDGKVTGVQFAIMLCRLLGYDSQAEGLVGSAWQTKGAALAQKAGLNNGVVAGTAVITRDGMAQMAFNALTANMVEYDGSSTVIELPGGGTITTGTKAEAKTHSTAGTTYQKAAVVVGTTPLKLCEAKFPNLKLTNAGTTANDILGHPANVWQYNNKTIATASNVAPTLTVKGEDYSAKTLENYTVAIAQNWYNGEKYTSNPAGDEWYTELYGARGVTLEFYANDSGTIDRVVITEPYFTVVDSIAKNGNVNLKVYEAGQRVNSGALTPRDPKAIAIAKDDTTSYDLVKDMAAGDVFMGIFKSGWDTSPANRLLSVDTNLETIEGKVTAKKILADPANATQDAHYTYNKSTITVDGTAYKCANEYSRVNPAVGKNGTLYVYNGYAYHFEGEVVAEVINFAYFEGAEGEYKSASGLDGGSDVATAKVRAVLADGTVDIYELNITLNTTSNKWVSGDYELGTNVQITDTATLNKYLNGSVGDSIDATVKGKVLGYTLKDGKMTLVDAEQASSSNLEANKTYVTALGADYTGGATSISLGNTSSKTSLVNKNTKFVVISNTGKDTKATVLDALASNKSLAASSNNTWVVSKTIGDSTTNSTATVVFTKANVIPSAATTGFAYVKINSKAEEVDPDDENGTIIVYAGTTNAEDDVTLTVNAGAGGVVSTNGVYQYNADNEITGAVRSSSEHGAVATVDEDLITTDNTNWLKITDDTKIVFVDKTLTEANGNKCYIIADSNEPTNAAWIFVIEAE